MLRRRHAPASACFEPARTRRRHEFQDLPHAARLQAWHDVDEDKCGSGRLGLARQHGQPPERRPHQHNRRARLFKISRRMPTAGRRGACRRSPRAAEGPAADLKPRKGAPSARTCRCPFGRSASQTKDLRSGGIAIAEPQRVKQRVEVGAERREAIRTVGVMLRCPPSLYRHRRSGMSVSASPKQHVCIGIAEAACLYRHRRSGMSVSASPKRHVCIGIAEAACLYRHHRSGMSVSASPKRHVCIGIAEAACLYRHRRSGMSVSASPKRHVCIGITEAACLYRHRRSGMSVSASPKQHACIGIAEAACLYRHRRSGMSVSASPKRHVCIGIAEAACLYRHHRSGMSVSASPKRRVHCAGIDGSVPQKWPFTSAAAFERYRSACPMHVCTHVCSHVHTHVHSHTT